jgi:hypothetical protein
MTLVITAATSKFVAQVSDRRLTYPDGRIYDDEANKVVVLQCRTAKLSMAYTGLGYIGSVRTDEWLVDVLTHGRAGHKPLEGVIDLLTDSATNEVAGLSSPPENKRLTFVLAGWYLAAKDVLRPVVWSISNCEGGRWEPLPTPKPAFEARFARQGEGADPRRVVFFAVHGCEQAFDQACSRRLGKVKRALLGVRDGHQIVGHLVSLVRAAASHPLGEQWIGRNCMSVVLAHDLETVAEYHPYGGGRPVTYGPHLVEPGLSIKDVEVWSQQPPWWGQGSPPSPG